MIPYVCDHPDRIAARIFRALRSDCPCCTFWRGALFGAVVGAILATAVAVAVVLRTAHL